MTPESRFVVSAVTRKVHVFNRQDSRQVSDELRGSLEIWGDSFLGLLEEHYPARVKLPDLVNVSLIDDAEIQRVHTQFMDSPVPTDVITFPYGEEGEILISIETASRKADELGVPFEREIALYLVHGLLHLAGYDDTTREARVEMEGLQDSLLTQVLGGG